MPTLHIENVLSGNQGQSFQSSDIILVQWLQEAREPTNTRLSYEPFLQISFIVTFIKY